MSKSENIEVTESKETEVTESKVVFLRDQVEIKGRHVAWILYADGSEKGIAIFANKLAVLSRDNGHWTYQSRGKAGSAKIEYHPTTVGVPVMGQELDNFLSAIKTTIPITNMPSVTCKFVFAPSHEVRLKLLGVRKPRVSFDYKNVRPQGKLWDTKVIKETCGLTNPILQRLVDNGFLKV